MDRDLFESLLSDAVDGLTKDILSCSSLLVALNLPEDAQEIEQSVAVIARAVRDSLLGARGYSAAKDKTMNEIRILLLDGVVDSK
jgi:hypothetical protein